MSKDNKTTPENIRNMTDDELQFSFDAWQDEKKKLLEQYGNMCRITGAIWREIAERKCEKEIDGYKKFH